MQRNIHILFARLLAKAGLYFSLILFCFLAFSKISFAQNTLVYYCELGKYPAINNSMKCCPGVNSTLTEENDCLSSDGTATNLGQASDALSSTTPPPNANIIANPVVPNLNTQSTHQLKIGDICFGYIRSVYGTDNPTLISDEKRRAQATLERDSCFICLSGKTTPNVLDLPSTNNAFTSLGCISTSMTGSNSIATSIFRIFYGLGLLLALFKSMMAGNKLMNSGNPDSIKEAREELIAIGTAFLFASAGLIGLSYLGVDVLGLGPYLSNLPKVV